MKVVSRQWSTASKNVFCFTLWAMLFALCGSVHAQQAGNLHRIGCLVYGSRSDSLAYTEALRKGVRRSGDQIGVSGER